jgi:peroxiredoxin
VGLRVKRSSFSDLAVGFQSRKLLAFFRFGRAAQEFRVRIRGRSGAFQLLSALARVTISIVPTAFRQKVQIIVRRCYYFILLLPIIVGCKPEPPPSSTPAVVTSPSIVQGPTSSPKVNPPAPAEPTAGSRRVEFSLAPFAGQPAPSLEGKDVEGKLIRLSDFRGKVVVVDFWMTGCPPCRAMIPHEKELVKRMQGRPFVLLGVSIDSSTPGFKAFLEKEQMTWPNICDGNNQAYAWFGIPPTLDVVDAKGVYRYYSVEEKDLDAVVEKLVQEAESTK